MVRQELLHHCHKERLLDLAQASSTLRRVNGHVAHLLMNVEKRCAMNDTVVAARRARVTSYQSCKLWNDGLLKLR